MWWSSAGSAGALLCIPLLGAPIPAAAQAPAGLGATEAQRRIVADLSGWSAESGQTVPFSRSTPEERAATASYLVRAMTELGLEARLNHYRVPNVNGLVDLLLPPYRGTNVYVEVPATAPSDEVVVLGAHYDSERRSPGAIDNASGVALVTEVAAEVAGLESRSRSFMFVFFDQEEDDEVGSRAFAAFLQRAGYRVHSIHVADLAGWDESGTGLVQIQSPTPELERLYSDGAARLGVPLEVVGGASSDNKSFLAAGLPTVGVFQAEIHPELHRATDTYEIVDFGYLGSMTRLVGDAMRALARP